MQKLVLFISILLFGFNVSSQMVANDDLFYTDNCPSSYYLGNILNDNNYGTDSFNGSSVVLGNNANAILTIIDGSQYPFTIDLTTGNLYNNNAFPGTFQIVYQLTQVGNPTVFDIGTITINVWGSFPVVQNDDFTNTPIDGIAGGTTPSVLLNDSDTCGFPLFNCIDIFFPTGFTLNADGTITVAPGTATGNYVLTYSGCTSNFTCTDGEVFIYVSGGTSLVANYDNLGMAYPGGTSSVSVLTNDTYLGGSINPSQVTITPLNVPNGFTIDSNGFVNVAASVAEDVYFIPYKICVAGNSNDCNTNYGYIQVFRNRFVGNVKYDDENNGCDSGDAYIYNFPIRNVNGPNTYSSQLNSNWSPNSYYLIGDSGTNVLSLNLPSYFTVTPATQTFTLSTPGTITVPDFCVSANSSVNDVEIYMFPLNPVVPGQAVTYVIFYRNWGSTTLSGQVSLQYENSKFTYQSSTTTPSATTANTLTFNYSNLAPFESRLLGRIKFIVGIPPAVDLGTTATFVGTITPISGDNTTANNTRNFTQIAVNSQDPNDIIVQEGPQITLAQAGDYLHYTIRFQNIGTSPAINIKVLNDLSAKLDWSTFQLLTTSHPCRVKNKNNQNEFLFEGINLPGTNDEPNSHGYITYKVKPKTNVVLGDVITNNALIYFDYNAPIATNTASTTIVNLGTLDEVFTQLQVSPNPTNGLLSLSNAFTIDTLSVRTLTGQLVIQKQIGANESTLDLSALENGIYLLTVQSEQQVKTIKIIKQ